jgi:hypothetical protein
VISCADKSKQVKHILEYLSSIALAVFSNSNPPIGIDRARNQLEERMELAASLLVPKTQEIY